MKPKHHVEATIEVADLLSRTERKRYSPSVRVDGRLYSYVPLCMMEGPAMRAALEMAAKVAKELGDA